jgi:hypothetical protein
MDLKYAKIADYKGEDTQYETWEIEESSKYELRLEAYGAPIIEILSWVKMRVPEEFTVPTENEDTIKRAKEWFRISLLEDQIFIIKEIHAYEEYKVNEEERFNAWVDEMQKDITKHKHLNK